MDRKLQKILYQCAPSLNLTSYRTINQFATWNTEGVTEWLKGKPKPDPSLIAKDRRAIDAVLSDSELKELWEGNAEDFQGWIAVLDDLNSRLSSLVE